MFEMGAGSWALAPLMRFLLCRAKKTEEYAKNFSLVRRFRCFYRRFYLLSYSRHIRASSRADVGPQVDVIQSRRNAAATPHSSASHGTRPSAPPISPTSLERLPADWSEVLDAASGRP